MTGSETILLVEDHEALRELTASVLRGSGYKLIEACGPKEAVKLCEQYEGAVHLLVTDVVMPGSSGLELAELLVKRRPHMAVLYMSGYSNDVAARNGLLKAGSAFLEKPFTPSVLRRKVREVLDAARAGEKKAHPASIGS
jgi:CheY-like chemotaxis protein